MTRKVAQWGQPFRLPPPFRAAYPSLLKAGCRLKSLVPPFTEKK